MRTAQPRALQSSVSPPAVDQLLKDYLGPHQTPTLEFKSPVAKSWCPTEPPKPKRPPPPPRPAVVSDAFDDEPITGRWDVTELLDPRSLVRDRAVLVRTDSEGAGRLLSIPREGAVLGRSSRATVQVSEAGVSRNHARIAFEYGSVFVEDMGSSNGTYVAGRRVDRCELLDGDLVQLGPRVTYRFSLMDSHQEDAFRRLYDTSVQDGLTGAHNRRYFDERLTSEIAFAVRHCTGLALVLLDIDYFKGVNDKYGHQAGDTVLRKVARLGMDTLRTEDVFARYGGEEFAVILRDTSLAGAREAAERIRRAVANTTVEVGGIALAVTLSAGCAELGPGPNAAAALIQRADQCLYRAKRDGRNRVSCSP